MKKTFSLLLVSFIFLFSTNAQIRYGVKAGASINNQTGFEGADKKSLITGQGSIFGIISLSKFVMLQPSVGYYPKGMRIANLTFEDQFGNPIGTGTLSYRFDYVELSFPIQLIESFHNFKISLGAGPYFSYAIAGEEIWKNVSGAPGNEPTKRNIPFGSSGFKRFDFGFVGLVSTQIQNKWMISVNYEIGVINSYYSDQSKIRNRSGGITFGYIFN